MSDFDSGQTAASVHERCMSERCGRGGGGAPGEWAPCSTTLASEGLHVGYIFIQNAEYHTLERPNLCVTHL